MNLIYVWICLTNVDDFVKDTVLHNSLYVDDKRRSVFPLWVDWDEKWDKDKPIHFCSLIGGHYCTEMGKNEVSFL